MISENILHMKRVDFLMLVSLMLVSSCSDKFQVVDPAEPVPVIYFMMNRRIVCSISPLPGLFRGILMPMS